MGAELPELFVDPPWAREARAAAAVAAAERAREVPLVPGLQPPAQRVVAWEPGEREQWQAERLYTTYVVYSPGNSTDVLESEGWPGVVRAYQEGKLTYTPSQVGMFRHGPEELVRPLLADWRPSVTGSGAHRYLQAVAARFELDALPAVVANAKSSAYDCGPALLPFLDVDVARLMADWLVRLKSAQHLTRGWFARHGLTVVPYLVPDALGKTRVPREKATAALSLLAATHGAAAVVAAAAPYGDAATAGIARILEGDTTPVVHSGPVDKPVKPLKLPWLDRDRLPQVRLRDGRALPAEAVENLLGALTLAPSWVQAEPRTYPGLPQALDACDSASLAAFGWAVFENWVAAHMPPRNGWVIDQFLYLADDESVRRLGAVLLNWPGSNTDKHAAGVLGTIGTDTALMQLHRVSQRVKAPGLRRMAEQRLSAAARRRGLTAEELADRLVPDLGLDADGTLDLDYGTRRFTVGFDENLMPYVIDEAGTTRKALPKPGVKDDQTLAPAAYRRFAELKKQARGVAGDQIRRLELAMTTGRRWSTAEFEHYLVAHPLLRHIARRLVWTTGDTFFRIAEDFTLADIEDTVIALPDAARIGIAHPLELGAAVADWSDVFADYQLTQPFRQLGRPVYTLTPEERETGRIHRFTDTVVPVGAVLGLTRRGWERGPAEDNGIQHSISRPLGDRRYLTVELDPGIAVTAVDLFPEQKLREIYFTRGASADLDAVTASELLADLAGLT
ncbi:DUF4132 domain-containing protein [Nocardia sp. NPDC050406]|uniref:DUF4132 domain-containing protein n=1 Tax=Nocardia sp. NPDC050406 TaxID=3364318 RepID=UPI00378D937D